MLPHKRGSQSGKLKKDSQTLLGNLGKKIGLTVGKEGGDADEFAGFPPNFVERKWGYTDCIIPPEGLTQERIYVKISSAL